MTNSGSKRTASSNDMSEELSFTGERLIPGKTDPDLFNEHFARYVYARGFCSGKNVLDTGCGVGYGSSHLAEVAQSVVGVDNDPQAIQYARRYYSRANTHYVAGDCQQLPFVSRTFDVVTSFELIEHLADAKSYLAEVRRVLEPGGVFIVSTPNRSVYGEHRGGEANPFHVREWDFNEFVSLLRAYFRFVEVLGESHLPAVGILASARLGKLSTVVDASLAPTAADYFVCVCSQKVQDVGRMVFVSSSGNVLLERGRHIRLLSNEIAEHKDHLTRLQVESDEKARWADRLNNELAEHKDHLTRLQVEFNEKARWADRLNAEMSNLRVQLQQSQDRIQELSFLWSKGTRWKRALVFSALAPADGTVGCALVATEIAAHVLRKLRPRKAPIVAPADVSRCSIIVLSWEGKELLAESLPALLRAVRFHGGEHEVIVLDNGSTDGTSEYVQEHFPEVRVVRSERNIFYTGGNNLGLQAARNDIIVLLNNDMIVHEDFLAPLLQGFRGPDVFAIASQVFLADPSKRREETGKTRAGFNGCDLDLAHEAILPSDEERRYVPVFWGHGGAVALDRQKVLWLGGLDALFDPFYVEDVDLSYRAWKVGWRCLLAVGSHVVHKHRGTNVPRYGSRFISQIIRRNQYLFIWKNFGDMGKLVKHFLCSPRRRIQRAGVPGVGIRLEAKAFLGAVERLPAVLKRKLELARSVVRSDEEVLQLTSTPQVEAITESELDFERGDCAEQLAEGWYSREQANGKSFRWMSKSASVFLRAPAETANLCVCGYVSSSPQPCTSPVVLAVSCQGEQKRFRLREGPFEQRWTVTRLTPGTPVTVQLAVSRVLTTPMDPRMLGIIVHSIALSAPTSIHSEGHRQQLHPQATVSSPLPPSRAALAEQRRVLIVCAYLPCLGRHGGGNMMFHLIRLLSRRHRLTVLAFYEEDAEREQIPPLAPFCEQLEVIYRGQSFEASNVLGLKPPEIVNAFYHQRMRGLVEKYLKTQKFDLIQCEYLQTAHFADVNRNIPAVLTNHEVLSLSYASRYRALSWRSSKQKFSALRAWMRMLNYEERLLRRFAAVVVLTEAEREFLARYAPRVKVYRHPMGVDSDFFCPRPQSPENASVVFIGNFRHSPNLSGAMWFLQQVWPRIRARNPQARLYLVGGSPTPALLAMDGLEGVAVTGFVEDVRPYLRRAAVFVAPILEGAGLRTKVLEAWAMQKPVVGTRLAFEGLTDQDGEVCRMAEDPETFADRVCELLQNTELANQMGVRARQLVLSNFSWEAFADLYVRIYQEMLGPAEFPAAGGPAVATGLGSIPGSAVYRG